MTDRTKVFNTDCVKSMRDFPDKHFELAIVDPPYGIGDTWSKNRNDRFYSKGKQHRYQNEKAPGRVYFKELLRVSKNQIIWGGNYFTKFLPPTNSWIVWNKHNLADSVHMSEAELAWTSCKKVMRVANLWWSGAIKCEPSVKVHPHQKPVMLYSFCLQKFAKKGDKILDTHMGSGSSRIASFDAGFEYHGFEVDTAYFEASCKRFEQHKAQLQIVW